jgi:hypothetical protein
MKMLAHTEQKSFADSLQTSRLHIVAENRESAKGLDATRLRTWAAGSRRTIATLVSGFQFFHVLRNLVWTFRSPPCLRVWRGEEFTRMSWLVPFC